ncbi:MAG: carbamate kinase [Clostridiales bacterium]
MKEPRIVIALGGNALGNDGKEQQEKLKIAAPALVGLIAQGYEIVLTHGNGPQVGVIKNAFDYGSENSEKIPPMELAECAAMSQGYIGYHLQKALLAELRNQNMPWHVATVVTQVEVDKNDIAFENPQKPIGAYYTQSQAEDLMKKYPNMVFKEDAGRGYRRMVPSPKPQNIVEKDSILNLLDHEFVVIACGGGGIPVIKESVDHYQGVAAVIDKDFAGAKLGALVDAEYFFILTAVDRVSINFGKPDEKELKEITVAEAEAYIAQGHFAPGSMLPKVEAAIDFAKSGKNRVAVIASLEKAPAAILGESGTRIIQ